MDDSKKEAAISIIKSGLSNVPFIGQLLTEVLFEYSGRIKQQRLNDFIEIMKKSIEDTSPSFDIEKIKSENFADLLENVLRKAAYAKSKKKLVGFKNILFKGIKDNSQIDRCEIFAELLSQISNQHIEILQTHADIIRNNQLEISYTKKRSLADEHHKVQEEIRAEMAIIGYPKEFNLVPELEVKKSQIIQDADLIEITLESFKPYRINSHYNLSKGDFLFYLQDLSSKALLMDEGVGSIGTEPFEIMTITDLGLDFLQFIEES